jgi:NADH-quinone oxidoreductase subunit M
MGALVALDLLPFALLWLLALLPTPRLLGAGGGPDCASARRWFALLVGGATVPMLVAVVVLWVSSGSRTFELDALLAATRGSLSTAGQAYLFGAFLLAFAAESALFPLHLWLPRALPAAPASAAVSLGVKVGAYGLLRFALPFFPAAASHPTLRLVAVTLAVVGMVYCTLVAAAQRELGRLVAYASAAQLGLVTLGTFALTVQGVQGALVATLGHGVSVGALLLLVGMLRRRGTTAVRSLVGAGRVVPVLAALLSLAALGAVGIPGTNGFVGAYLVLEGAYAAYPVAAVVAGLALVVAVAYLLIALRRLHRGPPSAAEGAPRVDLDRRERLVLGAFAVAIVWLGVAPEPILQRTEGAARRIVEQVTRGAEAVPVDTPGG